MVRCIICSKRPANGGGYCAPCGNKIESERKSKANQQPVKFLTYKGNVVGLYRNGGDKLTARLLSRAAENLPKSRTIDLNNYCDGFTREMIKKFKKTVLQLANAK